MSMSGPLTKSFGKNQQAPPPTNVDLSGFDATGIESTEVC